MAVAFQITQDHCLTDPRRDRLAHVGELYGTPLTAHQLDELASVDDLTALRRAFPWLSPEELHEALWALGQR